MKICRSCGASNRDDSRFCSSCGAAELEPAPDPVSASAPTLAPLPPPAAVHTRPVFQAPKPDFTRYDLSTIFGFVAAIVGLFQISLILEPLALVTSILGFARGKRYRGLAVAGVVIAAIGLLLRFFWTLYNNGVIPQWVVTGTFE